MKYQYCENGDKAWVESYCCTSTWCEADCDCGLTFEQSKKMVVNFYESRLEETKGVEEGDY